jgi:putative membrane protein
MVKFIIRWIINAIGLYLAIFLLDGRGIDFTGRWIDIVWLALIFGLINAFLRPLLKLLTCPLIILTLGLFTLLINTFLFWLTGWIGQSFDLGLSVNGFWPAFLGGLIISVVSFALSMIFRDEFRGRKR